MNSFTKWFWGKVYNHFPQLVPLNKKVELAKNSSSIALNIFSAKKPGETNHNNLNLDQVLEIIRHYFVAKFVDKKESPTFAHISAALLTSFINRPNLLSEQSFASPQFWKSLECALIDASLLNKDALTLTNPETHMKLIELALLIAQDSFSAELKVAIAKQFSGLADSILFLPAINKNLALEHKKQIISFYITPSEREKPANAAFLHKLSNKKELHLDAYESEDLADLYITGGLLNAEHTVKVAMLHSDKFLEKHWQKIKAALLNNEDESVANARYNLLQCLNFCYSDLSNYEKMLKQQEYSSQALRSEAQSAEYVKMHTQYVRLKAEFDRLLFRVHQDRDLMAHLKLPLALSIHACQLDRQKKGLAFSAPTITPTPSVVNSSTLKNDNQASQQQEIARLTTLAETLIYRDQSFLPAGNISAHQMMVKSIIQVTRTTHPTKLPYRIVDFRFHNDVAKSNAANALGHTVATLENSLFVFLDANDLEKTHTTLRNNCITKDEYDVSTVVSRNTFNIDEQTFTNYSHKSMLLFAHHDPKVEILSRDYQKNNLSNLFRITCEKIQAVRQLIEATTKVIKEALVTSAQKLPDNQEKPETASNNSGMQNPYDTLIIARENTRLRFIPPPPPAATPCKTKTVYGFAAPTTPYQPKPSAAMPCRTQTIHEFAAPVTTCLQPPSFKV